MLLLSIGITATTACLCGVAAFLWQRRTGDDRARHIARLAMEIDAVAGTIESDLQVDGGEAFIVFGQRCRENRQRAREALGQGRALREQEAQALVTTLLLLHDDHRRMVDLRSEVDRAVARRAAAAGEDRCREIRFGRPKPSRWPASTLRTRPSTFS